MNKQFKIAELGMIDMLYEIKNPLTNIRLSLELLECGTAPQDPHVYYNIIKESAITIESSIREICSSFEELGLSLCVGDESPEIE